MRLVQITNLLTELDKQLSEITYNIVSLSDLEVRSISLKEDSRFWEDSNRKPGTCDLIRFNSYSVNEVHLKETCVLIEEFFESKELDAVALYTIYGNLDTATIWVELSYNKGLRRVPYTKN